jgi:ankyrin repeat protein
MSNTTSWWDNFSNNLATDLTPLIALFGESPTKQYLSECLSFTDILIFATAPIGIITAGVSAIRVCGSSTLRAFIGRAQEGGGSAEAELCSSTSRDVCELYINGGIARVFGRPKLLEIVLDHQPEADDFYKRSNSDEALPSAGIYSFREYISKFKDRDWKESTGQLSKLTRRLRLRRQKAGPNGDDPMPDAKLGKHDFAPNPNLSLNIGIKKHGKGWFVAAAILGVLLQSAVLVWAAVARYKLHFVRDDPTDKYAVPLTIMGTIFLAVGIGLCAFLVENSTEERVFRRKIPGDGKKLQSHMYWMQPGIQYVGDQAFDSFAYTDIKHPLTMYTSSKKRKLDDGQQVRLVRSVWVTITLTTTGFIMQFLGLRACHSSVAVFQLGVIIVMSIVRALLRTQRMEQEENDMNDRPDAYVGHELDWLALNMNSGDGSSPSTENYAVARTGSTHWDIPSSAVVTSVTDKPLPGTPSIDAKDSPLPQDSQPESVPVDGAKYLILPQKLQTDVKEGNWLCESLKSVYNPGNGQDKNSTESHSEIPYESARRFFYRSRLARMTTDWNDDYVATRIVARNLAQAIARTANVLTFESNLKADWKNAKVVFWPIRIRFWRGFPKSKHHSRHYNSHDNEHGSKSELVHLALTRTSSEKQSSKWIVDESELEAVLGLWAWTLSEQYGQQERESKHILHAHKHLRIFRVLSSKPRDWDSLTLWRNLNGTPIVETPLSELSPEPLLLCGLHNSNGKLPGKEDSIQALEFKGTIPEVCAQELYSLFFLSILKSGVEDIGGKTTSREGFEDFLLMNTTISQLQQVYTESHLGSADDAFACTIPALISLKKLPSVLGTLTGARRTAEEYIKNEEWRNAESLLQWSLVQCGKETMPVAPTNRNLAFDFENDQRLLILTLCECYRKSILTKEFSDFGVQGFVDLLGTRITTAQGKIESSARECTSKSLNSSLGSSPPLEVPSTLAIVIKQYATATLLFTEEISNRSETVTKLRKELHKNPEIAAVNTSSRGTMKDEEIRTALDDKIKTKNLPETLYLIGRIHIENRKLNLDNSLFVAAENGWYSVVRALMELGANPDSRDSNDRTAITYATLGGDLNTFQYLYEEGFYPSFMDKFSRSPLSYASEKGYARIAQKLLRDGRVIADLMDASKRTPLSYAAENRDEAIVQLLLDTGKVEVDSKDSWSRTPLSYAAKNGDEAIVQLLLDTGKVEVDSKDNGSRTPLSYAAENGDEAIVQLLLDTGKVEVDSKDRYRRTPLSYAAENGDEAIVQLLLNTGKVEVDSKDNDNRTPLSYAAENRDEAIVQLLLDTGKVKVDSKDRYRRTPLSYAAENGDEAIVQLLLNTGKVEVDSKDNDNRTPLSYAAENRDEAIVQLLLDTGKVKVNLMDRYRRTPLSYAAENGHKAIVQLLLDTGEVKVGSKEDYSRTPLSYAAENGHKSIVQLLQSAGAE